MLHPQTTKAPHEVTPIIEVVRKLNEIQPALIVAYGSAYLELVSQSREGNLNINPQYLPNSSLFP